MSRGWGKEDGGGAVAVRGGRGRVRGFSSWVDLGGMQVIEEEKGRRGEKEESAAYFPCLQISLAKQYYRCRSR